MCYNHIYAYFAESKTPNPSMMQHTLAVVTKYDRTTLSVYVKKVCKTPNIVVTIGTVYESNSCLATLHYRENYYHY